jgi:putative DNA primase/helicase
MTTPEQLIQSAELTQPGAEASSKMMYLACELVRMGCSGIEAIEYLSQYNQRLAASGIQTWSQGEIEHKVSDAQRKAKPNPKKMGWRGGVQPEAPAAKKEIPPVTDEEFLAGCEASLKACGPDTVQLFAQRYGLKPETVARAREALRLGARPDRKDQPRWIWPGTWQDETPGGKAKRISAKGRPFRGLWMPWTLENPVGVILCEGAKDALAAAEAMPGWQCAAKVSVTSKLELDWIRPWRGLPVIIAMDAAAPESAITHIRLACEEMGLRPRTLRWREHFPECKDGWDIHDAFCQAGADGLTKIFLDVSGHAQEHGDAEDPTYLQSLPPDDRGNALAFARRNAGRLHYSKATGWTIYDKIAWQPNWEEAPLRAEMAEMLQRRKELSVKVAPVMSMVGPALQLAQGYLWRQYQDFDAPETLDLLPTPNGTINLRTGDITPNNPEQLITAKAATGWNPTADPAPWHEFMIGACGEENADWLQVALGYALTGYATEECLIYFVGPRRAGKGTVQTALLKCIGAPTCQTIGFESLTRDRGRGDQGFDLARLNSARIVFASESDEQTALNPAMLKRVSGGDEITASYKGKDQFTFLPKFTTVVASNEPPIIPPDDSAAWGRIRIIEFPHSYFGKENATLKERFATQVWRERILAWLVAGARRWFTEFKDAGKTMRDPNADKKEAIRFEQDPIGQWLSERCVIDRALKCSQGQLYDDWCFWADRFGHFSVSAKKFGMTITRKGFAKQRASSGYTVLGLRTKWNERNFGYDEPDPQYAAAEPNSSQDSFF